MAVNVKFGASTEDLQAGVARAKDAVQGFIAPVNDLSDAFGGLSKSGTDLTEMFGLIGGGAVVAGVAALLATIGSMNREMLDLAKNAKEVGLSIGKFQEVKYAANLGGVNDSQFLSSLQTAAGKLNDLLHTTSELSRFLDANNVKYEQANGKLISMDQYLQVAARLVQNAATEGDKFKAAELLGFSRDWVAVLEKGPAALRASEQAARDTGAVIDDAIVKRDAEFAKRWNDTVTKWSSFFKEKIVEISDAVGTLLDQMGRIPPSGPKWSPANASAADQAELEREKLGPQMPSDAIGPALGGGTAAGALVGFGLAGPLGAALGASLGSALTDDSDKVQSATARVNAAFGDLTGGIAKVAAAAKDASADAAGKSGATTVFPGAPDPSAARAAIDLMRGQIQEANLAYQNEMEHLSAALSLHLTTEQQKTAATIAGINAREDAEFAAIAIAEKAEGLTLAQQQQIENEKNAIIQKAVNERDKIQQQSLIKYAQEWQSALGTVESAFNSQLRGLLAGTETWSQAFKKMLGDLIIQFIEFCEGLVVKWAATQLALAAGGPASLAAGLAQRVAAIAADTGQTFAGFAAFLAPTMGPAAIPTALGMAESVQATALGLSSLDVGGYVLSDGLAMIHAGETITPAQVNTPYQGGGAGGVAIHINGPVIGTQAWINSMVPQLQRALSSYSALNPSGA